MASRARRKQRLKLKASTVAVPVQRAFPGGEPVNAAMAIGTERGQIGRVIEPTKFNGYDVVNGQDLWCSDTAGATPTTVPLKYDTVDVREIRHFKIQ